jgi:hypothetical protein
MESDQPLAGRAAQLSPGKPAAKIILETAECQVVPGETARFPFVVLTDEDVQSTRDLDVVSDNPDFNREWAHIIGSIDGAAFLRRYILEIRPTHIPRHKYGRYPLFVTWGAPGTPQYIGSPCVLVIKPCVCLKAEPVLAIRPTGKLSLSLENCGDTGVDVTVTLSHHGSSWSRGWEFELGTEDGPFEFSEQFDLPPGARRGEFDVEISAEGIPVARRTIRPRRFFVARKHIAAAALTLAAIAGAITYGFIGTGTGTTLHPQAITFTSALPTGAAAGDTYQVTATGGGSGNPVAFTIDPSSTSACSISGATVTFNRAGLCTIDANQAGNASYRPAPQAQQTVTVAAFVGGHGGQLVQVITFTSTPPASAAPGDTYRVTATGGGSGIPVTFTIDPSSTSVCSISGSTVTFNQPGTCLIDANEAGDAKYQPAAQIRQSASDEKITQKITITSAPPTLVSPKSTYQVTATGGGSDNPVKFSIDPSTTQVCSIFGSTVTFLRAGSCVIDANEAGDARYQPAAQAEQTVTVAVSQVITFTSPAPAGAAPGDTYQVTATGGGSGNPVTLSIDPSSTSVCSISGSSSGSTVTFNQAGTCLIDATQAGNADYLAAQAQQPVTVTATSSGPSGPAGADVTTRKPT